MRCVIPKQSHFVYPSGKPIIPHLRRYQGFAVVYYSVTLDALYPGHPRLSLNRGIDIMHTPLNDLWDQEPRSEGQTMRKSILYQLP